MQYENNWQLTKYKLPPTGEVVQTKIDGVAGLRNEANLKFKDGLWWLPDGSIYLYYTPTHWAHISK